MTDPFHVVDPSAGIPGPGSRTRLFLLLGDPVAHSLSPRMQNAALRALGLDGVYAALRTRPADVSGVLRGVAGGGGGGNVTLPHKEAAARAVDEVTPAVVRTGACNTFWGEDEVVLGDNTDVAAVGHAANLLRQGGWSGARILLLGAGGAARAAGVALLEEGPELLGIRNRSASRAAALAERLGDPRVRVLGAGASPDERWDLVVQATSLGLQAGDPLPMDPDPERVGALLDLVYGRRGTPLVRLALDRGIPAVDGTEMLLRQGMASFRRWWGRPAPEDAMRAALLSPPLAGEAEA